MGKSEEVEVAGEGKDVEVKVKGTTLVALMARSSGTVAKVEGLLDKVLDNKRVADDPDMLLRIHRQVADYNIAMLQAVAKLIESTKTKDGRIPGLSDQLLGAVEGTVGAAIGGGAGTIPRGRAGKLLG